MRIIYFLWALVFVLSSCKEKPSTSIVLKNPINEERVDESFRLSRMELRAVGDRITSCGEESGWNIYSLSGGRYGSGWFMG